MVEKHVVLPASYASSSNIISQFDRRAERKVCDAIQQAARRLILKGPDSATFYDLLPGPVETEIPWAFELWAFIPQVLFAQS